MIKVSKILDDLRETEQVLEGVLEKDNKLYLQINPNYQKDRSCIFTGYPLEQYPEIKEALIQALKKKVYFLKSSLKTELTDIYKDIN